MAVSNGIGKGNDKISVLQMTLGKCPLYLPTKDFNLKNEKNMKKTFLNQTATQTSDFF
jgi:hypothetical protein